MNLKEQSIKIWNFLKEDSWQSWVVSLILLIVIIEFVFFPLMSFATGSKLPLVIVESCSMYHASGFDSWWDSNGAWYEAKGINKSTFKEFTMKNGLNKGDILLVTGVKEPKLGDIIIFDAGSKHPLIHRVVSLDSLGTKGDHNSDQLIRGNNILGLDETNINDDILVGKASFKIIPLLGWVKLIWFEPLRNPSERGFCK